MADETAVNQNKDTQVKNGVERTQRTASHRLFLDDVEYQSFVRRLDWSPDGNVLLTPSACFYDLNADTT